MSNILKVLALVGVSVVLVVMGWFGAKALFTRSLLPPPTSVTVVSAVPTLASQAQSAEESAAPPELADATNNSALDVTNSTTKPATGQLGGLLAKPATTPESATVSTLTINPTLRELIVIGDTGTGDDRQQAVARAIQSHCQASQSCAFGVVVGDVIYPSGVNSVTDSQFTTKFASIYQSIGMPWFIVLGNHDYQGCVECYQQTTNAGPWWQHPGRYYQITHPDLLLLVIDTENFNVVQQEWLQNRLVGNLKPAIVFGHQPIISHEETKSGEYWPGENELSAILCQQADLYIAGHAHALENVGELENCRVDQIVSGGGGAEPRPVLQTQVPFGLSSLGFLSITWNEAGGLRGRFYNQEEQELHSFVGNWL